MTAILHQPNLTEGLTLLGWRLKRDAEIRERKDESNFECEVEPTSTSYAAFEYMSTTDDGYDPYAGLNIDLCLEVDAIDLNNTNQQINDDYDPYEVFMRMNTRRTVTGRERAPLALLPSHTTTTSPLVNNYRHYNFADDDTPVKYPLAIGHIDRRLKQQNIRGGYTPRTSFDDERRSREYPPSASSKRVTFRHSNDFNSGDDFDEEEEDDDSLEGDLHQPIVRRNKPPKRTAARLAVQRFRSNNIRSSIAEDDLDDDIAPTVTEMDMLEDQELDEDETNIQTTSTKTMSSPVKLPPPSLPPSKPTGGTIKSSYIGNMLPSFYEQLPESKKMLLQDATIDSSSNSPTTQTTTTTTTTDASSKSQIEVTSPGKKQVGLTTEHIEGPGGEEIIDEENRLQFRNTTIAQPYKRTTGYQNTKRYYENDDDDDQQQMRKRMRNDDDYMSAGMNRHSQYGKQHRYRKYEEDEEYDINQDTQQQQQQQQEEEFQQTIRVPARRGRPPSQHHQQQQQQQQQEDPSKKYARIIAQYEEQHGLKLGDMRVFAPKLRLRISSVNVNWINLPPIPKLPNKVHQS
ncbi:unnamed protein product [Rotaria sordida]|uniref:Uncharacterized protein n=1 Tax=Rotaria sordida TaxID=392033 RepID=A0A814NFW7_9BILA|nr:unnamed protein product [Rotaria sordida]CAF1561277.1 unnamed protein product [Rotaria sordida]